MQISSVQKCFKGKSESVAWHIPEINTDMPSRNCTECRLYPERQRNPELPDAYGSRGAKMATPWGKEAFVPCVKSSVSSHPAQGGGQDSVAGAAAVSTPPRPDPNIPAPNFAPSARCCGPGLTVAGPETALLLPWCHEYALQHICSILIISTGVICMLLVIELQDWTLILPCAEGELFLLCYLPFCSTTLVPHQLSEVHWRGGGGGNASTSLLGVLVLSSACPELHQRLVWSGGTSDVCSSLVNLISVLGLKLQMEGRKL